MQERRDGVGEPLAPLRPPRLAPLCPPLAHLTIAETVYDGDEKSLWREAWGGSGPSSRTRTQGQVGQQPRPPPGPAPRQAALPRTWKELKSIS